MRPRPPLLRGPITPPPPPSPPAPPPPRPHSARNRCPRLRLRRASLGVACEALGSSCSRDGRRAAPHCRSGRIRSLSRRAARGRRSQAALSPHSATQGTADVSLWHRTQVSDSVGSVTAASCRNFRHRRERLRVAASNPRGHRETSAVPVAASNPRGHTAPAGLRATGNSNV